MPLIIQNPFKWSQKKSDEQIQLGLGPTYNIIESFKSQANKKNSIQRELTDKDIVEHPFNFEIPEGLYTKYPLVLGVIDKYMDHIIGGGFFVHSVDKRAEVLIEEQFRDLAFNSVLQEWIKEALIKGTGFLEIGTDRDARGRLVLTGFKVVNANDMYIRTDAQGDTIGYVQLVREDKHGTKFKEIPFTTDEMIHITINKIAGCPYGYGIIQPCIGVINSVMKEEQGLSTVLERKAGNPYHVKIGKLEKDFKFLPKQADIDNFRSKLEFMNLRNEWVTGPEVDITPIDFGNLSGNFEYILRHHVEMLYAGFQVPEVMLSSGQLNEGIAKVQIKGFDRRIASLQIGIEKVIEQQIINILLEANGFETHVEFEWGQPDKEQINTEIVRLTELLKLPLRLPVLDRLEEELLQLLNINPDELELPDREREHEEEEPQPLVPGQNREENIEPFTFGELVR